jgi:predicted hydrolase (HD superfamily)
MWYEGLAGKLSIGQFFDKTADYLKGAAHYYKELPGIAAVPLGVATAVAAFGFQVASGVVDAANFAAKGYGLAVCAVEGFDSENCQNMALQSEKTTETISAAARKIIDDPLGIAINVGEKFLDNLHKAVAHGDPEAAFEATLTGLNVYTGFKGATALVKTGLKAGKTIKNAVHWLGSKNARKVTREALSAFRNEVKLIAEEVRASKPDVGFREGFSQRVQMRARVKAAVAESRAVTEASGFDKWERRLKVKAGIAESSNFDKWEAKVFHPGRLAAESHIISNESITRALRRAHTMQAHATAKLIKRGRFDLKMRMRDPWKQGAAGRKPFHNDDVELYLDQLKMPREAASVTSHEVKHGLQKIDEVTYRLDHELEAYQWQNSAFNHGWKDDHLINVVLKHDAYKNVPWKKGYPPPYP